MLTPNKTLVIRFSSIGDIVLASPLLRVLRKRFPASQIDFATRKEYSELVRYNPNLSHTYEFDTARGFNELQRFKETIRREHYDLVVDIHSSLRSRYLCSFNEAKEIVNINKRVFARTMLVKFKKNFYRDIVSIADRYIEAVRKFGIENDGADLELFIPDEICARVTAKMVILGLDRFGKIVGFCASAKHATKCWPQDRFIELGRKLVNESGAKILLFGGPSDSEKCKIIAESINASTGSGSAIDFSGQFSLLETAAAMKVCNIIVTNDSGLMHIASAMKKKVVAIFGSTVREFGFFPVGTGNIVIEREGLYCRPCSHIGRSSCPERHFRCMNEIQVDEVIHSIDAVEAKE